MSPLIPLGEETSKKCNSVSVRLARQRRAFSFCTTPAIKAVHWQTVSTGTFRLPLNTFTQMTQIAVQRRPKKIIHMKMPVMLYKKNSRTSQTICLCLSLETNINITQILSSGS